MILISVAESIEVDLELLGIAAINDQLQDEVPETIAMLRAAGLKIWMLTGNIHAEMFLQFSVFRSSGFRLGDKMSTARQIALSCNLISPDELPSVVTVDDGGGDFVAYFTRLAQDTLRYTTLESSCLYHLANLVLSDQRRSQSSLLAVPT